MSTNDTDARPTGGEVFVHGEGDMPDAKTVELFPTGRDWLDMAQRCNDQLQEHLSETRVLAQRRLECVVMAVSEGCTHQMVADKLGIQRPVVTMLLRNGTGGRK